ncbi:MAG: glycosyltransferase family 39 protein [Candidatus Omnitrophica bacterium]|nr:glycosyltransferase family 39 protein [Candidatus Omnitrophota bacterium]
MKILWKSVEMRGYKIRPGLLLFLIIICGFLFRLNNLTGRSLWTDEFFTMFQSSGHGMDIERAGKESAQRNVTPLSRPGYFKSFLENDSSRNIGDVTNSLLDTDTHPPLYFWIIYAWRRFFGNGPFALRFFSVLVGTLSIFLSYKLGEYLFNRRTGIFCALFSAFSPFSVIYSQEARAYSLIMAIGLLSSIFLVRLEKEGRWSDAFLFSLFSAAGLYTHYFYVFTALGHFIYFNFACSGKPVSRKFSFSCLGTLFIFSPWLAVLAVKGYNFTAAGWIFGYPGFAGRLSEIGTGIAGYLALPGRPGMAHEILSFASLFIFSWAAFYGLKEMFIKYRRQAMFCLCMFLVPLAAMFFIDVIQHGALLRQERFWMFSFLGFVPLAGYCFNSVFSSHKAFTALFILSLAVFSFFSGKTQFGPAPKAACRWIAREAEGCRAAVFVCNMRGALFPQSYYMDESIYLIPVSNASQLANSVEAYAESFDSLFLVRHYHSTDDSLMNELFMETYNIGKGFILKKEIEMNGVAVSEFVKKDR